MRANTVAERSVETTLSQRTYQECVFCLMDTSDPTIEFDADGVCSHCHAYRARPAVELPSLEERTERLERVVEQIKKEGKGREYDCVCGVSGGIDSTMVLYLVKQMGLRPLAVHMDNGWNSELAVANVQRVLDRLDVDLLTLVIDWEEFRDLQFAFLRSSIANAEIPTDHAIIAPLYRLASERGIRHIMSGGNIVTEAVMPDSWMYDAKDSRLIKDVYRKYTGRRLKSYPRFGLARFFYWTFIKRIRFFPILNYIDYVKEDAIQLFEREFGWRRYEGKHFESIFTRYFQTQILPKKFEIDKRRAHLSTLILSGQLKRDDAVKILAEEILPPAKQQEDREFVLKKLGLSGTELEGILESPPRSHREFRSHDWVFNGMPGVVKWIKRIANARPT